MSFANAFRTATAFALLALLTGSLNAEASVSKDLESLDNQPSVDAQAAKVSSSQKSSVVQGRTVDRNNRLELDAGYGLDMGGNSYLNTQQLNLQAEWHFVPQFSLGVRYQKAFNQLSSEGQQVYNNASNSNSSSGTYQVPDVDYPDHSYLATASWYMFYGKLNFFDLKVVQFDVYSLVGAGQMFTNNDSSMTYTGGGGIAFWLTQHFSTRFEVLYQTYKDKPYTGERDVNTVVAQFSLGLLI